MPVRDSIVFIVDDDSCIREALHGILTSLGLRTAAFGSAAEYVACARPNVPGCLILDVHLPETRCAEFHRKIADPQHPPVVFVAGHGDIPSSLRAIMAGAVEFLLKPFSESELIEAVRLAIARDRKSWMDRAERAELKQRLACLTPRENAVLPFVVSGMLNKQAAAALGISEVTLQIHRGRIMRKMQAASFADLVRIAERLQIPITHCRRTAGPRAVWLNCMPQAE